MTSTESETRAAGGGGRDAPADPLRQRELPLAYVAGEAVTEAPRDLYIPPDALRVFLDAFEGPLDLLLYLIRSRNIDILQIDIAEITDQYMAYIDLMRAGQFELAAEYLVMAAMLAEIKSRTLLPAPEDEGEEDDPRMDLIRRLQEYERFKRAAEDLNALPRLHRDTHPAQAEPPRIERVAPKPQVELEELLFSLARVLRRAEMFQHHHIQLETLSTREKMSDILARAPRGEFVPLSSLLLREEGRLGVVVTFLAVMELMRDSLVEIIQSGAFGPIHIRSKGG